MRLTKTQIMSATTGARARARARGKGKKKGKPNLAMGRAQRQPSIEDNLIDEGGDASDDDNEDAAVLGRRTRPLVVVRDEDTKGTVRARARARKENASGKKRDSGEGEEEGNTQISC
jgi:hypothetical protein